MSGFAARSKALEQEKEADKLMKEANKLLSPSILQMRLKPDWEAACPHLERAALLYKQSGKLEKSIDAYERAATAQEKQASSWHAAKHMETCAELSKQLGKFDDSAKFYKMAANLFVECGKAMTATESLTKGARMLEESLPDEAEALYYDALDIFESEGRAAQSADTFRFAVAFLVRREKWADAVEAQMRFGAACDKAEARHSQMKAYVGAVVTWLYAGDAKSAWTTYQDAMEVEAFANSEEAYAVDALFIAYKNQDEEEIKRIIQKRSCFKNLDHQIGRLAVKLPTGKLKRMSRHLQRLMAADDDEEEEEEYEGGEYEGGGPPEETGEEVL